MQKFEHLSLMLDCSRNAAPTLHTIKRWITLAAEMGYNEIQLYLEDLYEMPSEPYFGYMRGRYGERELKELDAFACDAGIILTPCIQTLAHLNQVTRWYHYYPLIDTGDILLAGDERTYALIEKMFNTLSRCFSHKRINIGMDEAHLIGRGAYLDKNGYRPKFDILIEHLNRVLRIAEKYGFEPMMWGDMFYRAFATSENYIDAEIPDSAKAMIPDVELIYWDYSVCDYDECARKMKKFLSMGKRVGFAGSALNYFGFAPHVDFSVKAAKQTVRAALDCGLPDFTVTMWRDNGAEGSFYASLPALFAVAQFARGNTDEKDIRERFFKTFGIAYEDFELLGLPDKAGVANIPVTNPSKYAFYNDPFLGLFDRNLRSCDESKFAEYKSKLIEAAARAGEYAYLFETQAAFCDVMSVKWALGIRIREAYKSKDAANLRAAADRCLLAEEKVRVFYEKVKEVWLAENKPFGLEVLTARFGGLRMRLRDCAERLCAVADGGVNKIEELEEEQLLFDEKFPDGIDTRYNDYKTIITASIV